MVDRKPKTQLQQDVDEFFHMIGSCIVEWSSVEDRLFFICTLCLGCTKERGAIVYYKTPTIEARRTLADELVRTVLPKRARASGGHDHVDLVAWTDLFQRIRKLLEVRNKIAHHPVRPRFKPPNRSAVLNSAAFNTVAFNEPGEIGDSWFELYPGPNELARGKSYSATPLKISDLKEHLLAVNALSTDLNVFLLGTLAKHVAATP